MLHKYKLPPTFTIEFKRIDFMSYKLLTSQIIPLQPEKVFTFFENPKNLFQITPDWLDFKMIDIEKSEVFEGAEFDYTIKWLWMKIIWRSRIVDYKPPLRFTDIQVLGPYQYWHHLHTFEKIPEGTFMKDVVTYRIPILSIPLHAFIIKRQLQNIFCYRAVRIAEWATGNFILKGKN